MKHFVAIVPSLAALLSLGLAACGSVDHDPPKLKSAFGSVSPMDTLIAEFDKKLDNFDDSLVSSNVPITVVKQKGSRIYIVGATDTVAGVPRFEPGSDYDTLRLKNISDEDDNVEKDVQTATFSTYPFLDHDKYELDSGSCFSNDTPLDAESLMDSTAEEFYDGTKLSKGVTVTGILAGQYSKNCKDEEEYYRVYLKKRDSISIRLTGLTDSIPLELAVLGPAKIANAPSECTVDNEEFFTLDESDLKKGRAIDTTLGIGEIHECGTVTITDYLAYYVVVRYSESLATKEQLPQPYTLTVSIEQE